MAIEQDDVIKIIKLMDESDFDELHLEMGDLKLSISKSGASSSSAIRKPEPISSGEPERPSTTPAAKAPQAAPTQTAIEGGLIPIQSPLLGTFYRSGKPEAPSFVEIGSRVTKEDTVCLIEVMKTFTTVKAGVEGRIVKICAENAEMVEYQQTLFLVEPE